MAFVVCCHKAYFWDVWEAPSQGEWFEVRRFEDLTPAFLTSVRADVVFFTHWSRKVPAEIHEPWTCVNFHATPLPYGRGSSPVQHMILRGHEDTVLTAHRMVEELDAGPIYRQERVSLLGTGDEIYRRLARTMTAMIRELAVALPVPVPQRGPVEAFPRRTPAQSIIPPCLSLDRVFDVIRMLDVEGYPHACLEAQGYRLTFTHPVRRRDAVEAHVRIEAC